MKKHAFIIVALWISIILICTISNNLIFLTGKEVLLKTLPVDPRDLFRGDYVILNYEIANLPKNYYNYRANEEVYTILKTNKNNVAHILDITQEKPEGGLFIKGKFAQCQTSIPFLKSGKCINYGIESYFVKEGEGRKLEKDLRDGAFVKVVIDKNGRAKVKGFTSLK